jgi:hypothetical protein
MTTEPLNLTASRASFRDKLRELGLSRPDAVLAAELFAAVVPKTLAALVPEELTATQTALADLRTLAIAAVDEAQTWGPAMAALADAVDYEAAAR